MNKEIVMILKRTLMLMFAVVLISMHADILLLRSNTNDLRSWIVSLQEDASISKAESVVFRADVRNELSHVEQRMDSNFRGLDLSVLDSCGTITDGYGWGSCVAISHNIFLTAAHCIRDSGQWIEMSGEKYEIDLSWIDSVHDVGFVRVKGDVPFVSFGDVPELLDRVYFVGSPYQREFDLTITMGIISHLDRKVYGKMGLIQTDAEGAPGSSGCPLFSPDGKIVGICVAGPNPGGGVTLCVSVKAIREAYDRFVY